MLVAVCRPRELAYKWEWRPAPSSKIVDLLDQQVRFKVADVHTPHPLVVLYELHGNDLLEGRVVDLSDSGELKEVFAVVEVEQMRQYLIVPVACLVIGE
jgi:hypothetical protein